LHGWATTIPGIAMQNKIEDTKV